MKYEQKIKDNFNFAFLWRGLLLLNYLRQRQMFFVAMRYRAAALFPLFLHGKERSMWEQKTRGDVVQRPPRSFL